MDTYVGVVHGLGVDLRMGIKRTCLEQINRNVGSRVERVELKNIFVHVPKKISGHVLKNY